MLQLNILNSEHALVEMLLNNHCEFSCYEFTALFTRIVLVKSPQMIIFQYICSSDVKWSNLSLITVIPPKSYPSIIYSCSSFSQSIHDVHNSWREPPLSITLRTLYSSHNLFTSQVHTSPLAHSPRRGTSAREFTIFIISK